MRSFFSLILFCMQITCVSLAQLPPHTELNPEQISLDFLSSDGAFWYDCTVTKGVQPHSFSGKCHDQKFSLHLLLREINSANETTFELHYWATRTPIAQVRTQSTWLTVDTNAKVKRILSYIGFDEDSTQLRLQINLVP